MRTQFTVFLSILLALQAIAYAAAPIRAGDPAIGGYFYFASLNRRCGNSDPDREAALNRYKTQYLSHMEKILGGMGRAFPEKELAEPKRILNVLREHGPLPDDLAPFDALFATASVQEIDAQCRRFVADVSQRMELNALMARGMAPSGATSRGLKPGAADGSAAEPPFHFFSLQHLYALLKTCERVDPDRARVAARSEAFNQLLPKARSVNGLWRTFVDVDGELKETRFPNATAMFDSPEFKADLRRYLARVEATRASALKNDCAEFEMIIDMAGGKK